LAGCGFVGSHTGKEVAFGNWLFSPDGRGIWRLMVTLLGARGFERLEGNPRGVVTNDAKICHPVLSGPAATAISLPTDAHSLA